MKLRKALLAIPLIAPATIVPLSTMTSCSQVWGYKTPISIGTNIKGSNLDPFCKFTKDTTYNNLVDLNGEAICPQLQSNFAIDMASSTYYGYSLPQKWDTTAGGEEETITGGSIKWNKGAFVDGSAAWYTPSSSAFTLSAGRSGKKTVSGTTTDVSETKYSYRNNILATNIELVSIISSAINQFLNYSLQYQGTQIGEAYGSATETDTNLAIAWGGSLSHGLKDSDANKNLFESIFSSNAVSGTGKTQALLRPTHVEINFQDLPVVAYTKSDNNYVVSDVTKTLLNGAAVRPDHVESTTPYWSTRTDATWDNYWIENIRTGEKEKRQYETYTFNNVPVLVRLNSYAKSFVNPTINGGYQVSDFYSNKNTILNTVGNSWQGTIGKYTDGVTAPTASSYQWTAKGTNELTPIAEGAKWDKRLVKTDSKVQQNDFIVLLNFQYRKCTKYKIGEQGAETEDTNGIRDTVSMIGFSNIFPAFFLDKALGLVDNTFFVKANSDGLYGPEKVGYIIDSNKVNSLNNEFLNLVKRSSKEGMKAHAKDLSEHSKKLLKFLGYMFGNNSYAVDAGSCITKTNFAE